MCLFYHAAQLAGTLFDNGNWWFGHFPQPSFPVGQLVGSSQCPQRGQISLELIQALILILTNVMHEERLLEENGKYAPFCSTSPEMSALNISSARMGSARPHVNVLRQKNSCILNNFICRLTLATVTNSHVLLLMCPKTYYAKPPI